MGMTYKFPYKVSPYIAIPAVSRCGTSLAILKSCLFDRFSSEFNGGFTKSPQRNDNGANILPTSIIRHISNSGWTVSDPYQ